MMIRGTVVRGKGEGRKLGYPTANLDYTGSRLELGVYAARATVKGQTHDAIAIVGMWELANGLPSLEIYLLPNANYPNPREFDLYGKELSVEIGHKLRGLMRFGSEEELKAQIRKDLVAAGFSLRRR